MKIWNFLWGVSIFGESAFFCEDTWWIWEEYEDDGDNGTAGAFSQMSFCLALAWALAVLQNSGWFCVQPYMSSVLCYMCFVFHVQFNNHGDVHENWITHSKHETVGKPRWEHALDFFGQLQELPLGAATGWVCGDFTIRTSWFHHPKMWVSWCFLWTVP